MTISELISHAIKFRDAIESIPLAERTDSFKNFPRGSCGDASILMATYLASHGILGFEYICGERGQQELKNWTTHAWLRSADVIIDITADQFPDAPNCLVFHADSTWHRTFEAGVPQPALLNEYTGYGALLMQVMYSKICSKLENGCPKNS